MSEYPEGYRYTKDHEWVSLEKDIAIIGITDYAQEELGDIVYVEMPEVGMEVTASDPFGVIESVKAVCPGSAPTATGDTETASAPFLCAGTVNVTDVLCVIPLWNPGPAVGPPFSAPASGHTKVADPVEACLDRYFGVLLPFRVEARTPVGHVRGCIGAGHLVE